MPTDAATAGMERVEARSRWWARSSLRRRTYATTVPPVAVRKSRVRWLCETPAARATAGTVSGAARFASMYAIAALTAG
jgi:hypothetical protein